MFSFLKGDKEPSHAGNAGSAADAENAGAAGTGAVPSLDTSALTAPPTMAAEESASTGAASVGPLDEANTAAMQQSILDQIKTVFDPEIPVDIYELGLIYEIIVDADKRVLINMTLTSPACPSAQQIPSEVRWKVKAIPGVTDAFVEIVWEPAWSKERMSEAAKLQLGFF
jgi:FeS assembly SUF system protein